MIRSVVSAFAALAWLALPASGAAQSLAERIETCASCHRVDGRAALADTPSLAGQPADHLTVQLFLFRENLRPGTVMTPFAQGLSDAELQQLSEHFAGFEPAPPQTDPDPRPTRAARRSPASIVAAPAILATSAVGTRCRASRGSARTTSRRRCASTRAASGQAMSRRWPKQWSRFRLRQSPISPTSWHTSTRTQIERSVPRARISQCAQTARIISGGSFPPRTLSVCLLADERPTQVTGQANICDEGRLGRLSHPMAVTAVKPEQV